MTAAALLDAVRFLAGFVLGATTARMTGPCPICGQPTAAALCARCAPIVNPRRETP